MNIKNRINMLCLVISSMLVISGCNSQSTGSIKCTLKGVVIDRPQSSQIILMKATDASFSSQGIFIIPIHNGEFEYTFYCDQEELYKLVFYDEQVEMYIWEVQFMSEHGVINFTLYPIDQRLKNIVEGGLLNKEYWDYRRERSNKKFDNFQEGLLWSLQYAKERPNIVGYSILASMAQVFITELSDISPFVDIFQAIFEPKFPDHPYTTEMITLLRGSSLKAGIPFVDFTAIDLTGQSVVLSERIAGKPAVLHLWASWCGPCRKKGRELIPVYEEFRDKGFVVIGVARERNISAAEVAIQLDNYPWENLVELNDAEQIWVKYGIGNAAGSDFLIDENGIIVTVNPSIDEIRDFLKNQR